MARDCVRQSLVLLKNDPAAPPLSKKLKRVLDLGKAADDLGVRCGGWTISWQGEAGNITPGGTTILAAIRKTVGPDTTVSFSPDSVGAGRAAAVIVVVGEQPYAEMKGDRNDLHLPAADVALVKKARVLGAPVVTVLLSGRPLILGDAIGASDAFVAAWLPGTEGLGVTDILFGHFKPTGKLPRVWPGAADAGAAQSVNAGQTGFPFGFGLSYAKPAPQTAERIKTAAAN